MQLRRTSISLLGKLSGSGYFISNNPILICPGPRQIFPMDPRNLIFQSPTPHMQYYQYLRKFYGALTYQYINGRPALYSYRSVSYSCRQTWPSRSSLPLPLHWFGLHSPYRITENETQLFRREIERRVTWWLKSMSIQDHSNSATNLTKFDSSGQRMETVLWSRLCFFRTKNGNSCVKTLLL